MRFGFGLMAALTAAAISGCGGGGVSGLVPVTGTVTQNGQPLEGAEVTFLPLQSNTSGLPGNDVTGPSGNYKVMTQGRSGLMPGKYKVVVSKSLLDMSKAPENLRDDPHMYALSMGLDSMPGANEDGGPKISQEFEREVPPEGGIQDFDVKSK